MTSLAICDSFSGWFGRLLQGTSAPKLLRQLSGSKNLGASGRTGLQQSLKATSIKGDFVANNDTCSAREKQGGNVLFKMVDFRIPIWGVVGAMGTIVWALISSHFVQQQLVKDVAAVQSAITIGQREANDRFLKISNQASSISVDMAELRIRVSMLEASLNRGYQVQVPQASSATSSRAEPLAPR